ncbi:methyltransferase-like protein 22 isoform X3 [Procambarus clarkii]|uniref:methyltransferase-like protein 22 isoform X3 n=1 Tax=Procambarus clarkii TaxID=6728 RepID=UPI001E67659B|nr:methyltransferase-like protein 22 isoform X3 [Procambarus clarkii]
MAETYDTVTSEVHHFSKEESLDPSRGGKEKFGHNEVSKLHQMAETSRGCRHVSREATTPQDDEEEEEEEFECLLGANGQVVLWSSRREKHQSATTLDLVGEQVWRGALFMADFILNNPDIFRDAHILEVASGVGLTSIVAAMLAKQVIISDIDRGDILELIDRNIKRNTDLLKASVEVKEIDFFNHATIDEIMDVKKSVSILLAADVVYHDQLTDAFFRTILRLMSDPPNKSLYVALEKRFVFTQEDMDTVAPCYEHFLQGLEWLASQNLSQIDWTMEQLSTDFEQYFTYERTRHLVLWKIQATLK